MDIVVNATAVIDTPRAVDTLLGPVRQRGRSPDFLAVHTSPTHSTTALQNAFAEDGIVQVHGATTCQGVMARGAMVRDQVSGIGCFALWDDEGQFGTALADIGTGAVQAGRTATLRALEYAGRSGEAPDLVWVSSVPGYEEEIVQGIESVVGANTPVVGGSAADNDISGQWRVFDADTVSQNAVVVSVLFPSRPLSTAYQNGYAPAGPVGVVTRGDGRVLYEIDGQPAADVYADWTGGNVTVAPGQSAPILAASTFHPLGRAVATVSGVPFYVLAHPAAVREDRALELFCAVEEGERVHLMTGSAESLVRRAGRVASLAASGNHLKPGDVAGALVVYCGGCMLAVGEGMDAVAREVDEALGGAPSLGIFTFGEQGAVLSGQNHHGNLMISCVAFAG